MSNLDKVKVKATPIELNGETYHLKYDLNAFAELEDIYGSLNKALTALGGKDETDDDGKVIMVEDLDDDENVILVKSLNKDGSIILDSEGKPKMIPKMIPQKKISIKGIRAIFWAGLLHEHPKMTEREAGALLNISDMKYLAEKLAEAMEASMPNVKDEAIKKETSKKAEEAVKDVADIKNVYPPVST